MMRLTRSISLLVIVALSSYIWSAAQVDWDDDVYYVPSKTSQQDSRSNDPWGDDEYQYDNQDPLDAYNRRGEEYQGTRGQSYSSSQQPKKGVGKYSRRIMRFHNPATVYIYDSNNVDVYYNEDGTYGIYNYPDRYDYVADRYNPVGISINLWSPGWYPSWDYYYDYMWYSSWYPWYTNRYAYPYSWGGYNYWGPSIWYTNPWSWGGSYWYGYYPHYGGYGYGAGYNHGYWDGYYAGSYGIYDPYYGSYVKPSTYYSNGRTGSSYYDSSNPRASRGNQGTLSGNARRGSLDQSTYSRKEVADRGNFWKDDRNRIYDNNTQGRSARGSYDQSSGIQRRASEGYRQESSRSRRGSYFEDATSIRQGRQVSPSNRNYNSIESSRSRRGNYETPRNRRSYDTPSNSRRYDAPSSRSYRENNTSSSVRSNRGNRSWQGSSSSSSSRSSRSYDSPSNSRSSSSSFGSSSSSSRSSGSSSSSSSSRSARGRR